MFMWCLFVVFFCFYFFFFKQKTAYEMRISDWSSDVCSSDLERVIDSGRQGAQRDLDQLVDQELQVLSGRPGIAEREAAQDSLLDGLAGNLACFHHRQVGMNEIAGANTQRDRQLFRSEEHTSELQSLMRISYAVFCLKKK